MIISISIPVIIVLFIYSFAIIIDHFSHFQHPMIRANHSSHNLCDTELMHTP